MQNLRIIGSWELDLSTSELYWSDETKLIHGVELSYRPVLDSAIDFYRDDYREKISMAVSHLIELGENFDMDCCLITSEKDPIWVRSTGIIIQKDHDGSALKIGGTFENISHHYNKVSKLEKYWGILNDSNMLSISNKSGVINFVNDSFCKLTGFDRSEVVGKTHRIFNSGYHSKEFFEELWKTIQSGEKWEGEILNKNKCGKLQWIKTIIFPVVDYKGEITEFISIRNDITDQKDLQKKRVEKERLKVIGEVGGQILHEIMSPLTLINSYTGQLVKVLDGHNDEKGKELVFKLQRSSDRVVEIFQDMRSLLKDKDDYGYVDVSKIVRKSYFFTHINMQKNNIDFILDIQTKDDMVWGCSGQLGQVFTNLINNSIQAISGLDDKWIKVIILAKNNRVIIKFIDSGNGIPSENENKIFESLFTTKESTGGTGLGLAISKRLIERMGGEIKIDNDNPNTCFILDFPIKEPHKQVG